MQSAFVHTSKIKSFPTAVTQFKLTFRYYICLFTNAAEPVNPHIATTEEGCSNYILSSSVYLSSENSSS